MIDVSFNPDQVSGEWVKSAVSAGAPTVQRFARIHRCDLQGRLKSLALSKKSNRIGVRHRRPPSTGRRRGRVRSQIGNPEVLPLDIESRDVFASSSLRTAAEAAVCQRNASMDDMDGTLNILSRYRPPTIAAAGIT